jgi:fructose-1,6-bisphosphatase I
MVNALDWTGHLAGMASEGMEDPLPIPEMYPRGKYLVLFVIRSLPGQVMG